jgi:hypothetical protein
LAVRRTVTGLAVSDLAVMACEHVRRTKYASSLGLQQVSDCLRTMQVIQHNR